ncbi:hypothetical protein MAR_027218 [Mya arenaria]|uniref:Uncharacterized protein n=1 Tax=Mya arenaria TaxID=6604 RepID=A0ABY7ESU3_MYAAR|nr:hypothetical protein MAR_027218 [Mya arenaria]
MIYLQLNSIVFGHVCYCTFLNVYRCQFMKNIFFIFVFYVFTRQARLFQPEGVLQASEDIKDLQSVLDKWESPPLNEMSKYVRDVWDSLDSHRLSLLTIQQRLARQESTLRDIQEQLRCLLLVNASTTGVEQPRFYRRDTEDGQTSVQPTGVGRKSGRTGKNQTTTSNITIEMDEIDNLISHLSGTIPEEENDNKQNESNFITKESSNICVFLAGESLLDGKEGQAVRVDRFPDVPNILANLV